MKCADLRDEDVVAAVRRHMTNIGAPKHLIATAFPDVPDKVLRAKLSKLVRRGLLDGCARASCGCRGDFTIRERP